MYPQRKKLVRAVPVFIVALLLSILPVHTPAALAQSNLGGLSEDGGESWDGEDPSCQGAPRLGSPQQAEEYRERCMKTAEEKQREEEEPKEAIQPGAYRNTPGADSTPNEEQREDAYEQANERTDDGITTEEQQDGDSGFLAGLALDAFKGILNWVYENTIGKATGEIAGFLKNTAFTLPEPGEGDLSLLYGKFADVMKPAAVLLILYTGYLLMLGGANYNAAYVGQHALPRVALFIAGLSFFPDLMAMFSDISRGIADVFVSEDGIESLTKLGLDNVSDIDEAEGFPFLMVLGSIFLVAMMLLVLVVAVLKNVAFALLFVAAPFAMFSYAVPGLSGLAGAWFRAVVACFAIPALFALEMEVGAWMVRAPGMIFSTGESTDAYFSLLAVVVILWIMWKTPKQVLSWAFHGYSGSFAGHVARSYATRVVLRRLPGT